MFSKTFYSESRHKENLHLYKASQESSELFHRKMLGFSSSQSQKHTKQRSSTMKTALVTGGSQGLGEAICRRLAKDGFRVTIFDLEATSAKGQSVASDIGGSFFAGSVADPKAAEAAVKSVVDECGSLDALVNNAGITGSHKPIGEYDLQDWGNVIDVNLNGAFYFLKFSLAQMSRQSSGGAVVNMSSMAGYRGKTNLAPYVASKFAIRGLTQAAAVEYANKNIRVNCVAPTFVEVEKMTNYIEASDNPESMRAMFNVSNALPGTVMPNDVGAAVSFLLSDEARFITGHCLPVDAGALSRIANAPEK
jgi:NAD(P)-dependent dehydrogenase (short-subunit alcohol dehydrogenase family)